MKEQEKEILFVKKWTKSTKYDCPQCGQKKTIKHPCYVCKNCKTKYKLKMKF